jgi:plasmid maintenance system antidote protein VapI
MESHRRSIHPQPSSLVDQLRAAIANSGQTQYRIAKESGVPQPVVNRFMTGERGIGLETASKLCAYLRLRLARIR